MLSVVLAALGWLLVALLPGWLCCDALRQRAEMARNLSLAPVVGVGVVMAVGRGLQLCGVAVRAAVVVPVALGLPALVWLWRRRDEPRRRVRRTEQIGADSRRGRALLGGAMVAGLLTWCLSIPSVSAVLPDTDGAHHGLYAYRILALHTLDPNVVLAGDVASRSPTWHYYPLAIHLCAAMVSAVTGVNVNTALTVGMVLAAAVVLPLGIFVLTRRLMPTAETTAGVAAVIAATFAWFPFSPILWGGLALIVAMSGIPAAVDAVAGVCEDGKPMSIGVLLGVAAYGLFQEHNTELVAACLFGLVFVVIAWRGQTAPGRKSTLLTLVTALAVFVILIAPDISQLSHGASERSAHLGAGFLNGGLSTASWVLGIGNPLVIGFALGGLVVAMRRRVALTWVWCCGLTALLYIATLPDAQPFRTLTSPWYSFGGRVSYLFAFFESVFAALGLGAAINKLNERRWQPGATRVRLTAMLPTAVLATVYIALVVLESHSFVALAYRKGSRITADQRAGFAWLARHIPPGGRVLNEFLDDSGWMETLDGVRPLFATNPEETLPAAAPSGVWGDRWYLLVHAADLATDSRAQQAVRVWNVRYVYVTRGDMIAPYRARLSAAALAASPAYHEVWHRGSVTIFSIDVKATT